MNQVACATQVRRVDAPMTGVPRRTPHFHRPANTPYMVSGRRDKGFVLRSVWWLAGGTQPDDSVDLEMDRKNAAPGTAQAAPALAGKESSLAHRDPFHSWGCLSRGLAREWVPAHSTGVPIPSLSWAPTLH